MSPFKLTLGAVTAIAIATAGCHHDPPPQYDPVAVGGIADAILKFKNAYDSGAADLAPAEATLLASLTDADADLILKSYLSIMSLELGTVDETTWSPPAGMDALLQRYQNVPYLADLAHAVKTTTPQSLGVSNYALVAFPFTPACAPPGCHDQVRKAVLKALVTDALADAALEALLGPIWSKLAKKCLDGPCTTKDLTEVAVELFTALLVPAFRLTFAVIAFIELMTETLKYSQTALKACYDYQTAHCQMDMAIADLSLPDLATPDLLGCSGGPAQDGTCPPNLPAGAVCCPGPLSPGAQYRTWCQPGQNGKDPWGCFWCAGWHNVCSGGIWVCGADVTPSGRNYCQP
jgi:hypothetical protein